MYHQNNRVLGFLSAIAGVISVSSAAAVAAQARAPIFTDIPAWEGHRHGRGKTGVRASQRAAAKSRRVKAFRRATSGRPTQ